MMINFRTISLICVSLYEIALWFLTFIIFWNFVSLSKDLILKHSILKICKRICFSDLILSEFLIMRKITDTHIILLIILLVILLIIIIFIIILYIFFMVLRILITESLLRMDCLSIFIIILIFNLLYNQILIIIKWFFHFTQDMFNLSDNLLVICRIYSLL